MLNRIRTEPALLAGLVIVLANAAVAFGATLTDEQTFAINAVVAAVLALFTRSQVTPTPAARGEAGNLDPGSAAIGLIVGLLVAYLILR